MGPNMTLGALRDVLRKCRGTLSDGKPARVQFDFCGLEPFGVDSYRGFYEDIAIGWKPGNFDVEVPGFLSLIECAIGTTFTGWKGGDYVMREDTPVWVANRGECHGTALIAVHDLDYVVYLETAHVET